MKFNVNTINKSVEFNLHIYFRNFFYDRSNWNYKTKVINKEVTVHEFISSSFCSGILLSSNFGFENYYGILKTKT